MSATLTVFGTISSVEDLKYVGNQSKPVLKFSVVTPNGEPKKEGDKYAPSQFYKVEVWDKQALALQQHIVKGVKVLVSGNHVVREWETDNAKGVEQMIKYPKIELAEWQASDGQQPAATKTETPSTNDDDVPF